MPHPQLEIRQTATKGRGVFALEPIANGSRILEFQGRVLKSAELTDDLLAMQVGPDEWLCSDGSSLDDCVNHSCEPNGGFLQGDLVLYALRDIAPGEEIGWDYSTSIGEPGWTLDCRCGFTSCRGIVRSWVDLQPAERERLQRTALRYLRELS
jgi:SET domain-containing protein